MSSRFEDRLIDDGAGKLLITAEPDEVTDEQATYDLLRYGWRPEDVDDASDSSS